jgi:hypothetical protein
MNVDDITVPDPVYMKWSKNYSCQDSPTPVLKIRYKGLSNILPNKNSALITLTNKTAFTIKSCNYAIINFPVLVVTSLPAVSILYGNDFLFRHGLTCVINQIPTNDTLLHIKVYNHKLVPSTFEKDSLQFMCHTVLAKYP